MESLEYWRLCDEYTVVQAALLIVGEDPAEGSEEYVLGWEYHSRPKGFNAVFAALKSAINSKILLARIVHSCEFFEVCYEGEDHSDWVRQKEPNWSETMIEINDLKRWLFDKGFKTGFFFPYGCEDRDYLDPLNEYYAPKLAAAVKAWEAITRNPSSLVRKTPKQALEKWLRENATEFGLTKDDGTHNAQGIDQVAKVANWKPEGGATKTPAQVIMNTTTPSKPPANEGVLERTMIVPRYLSEQKVYY